MHYVLMTLVAATTIAAFESVGSILVIAMLIVPGAAAHLITDRLGRMLGISVVFTVLSAVLGHISAITVPVWFGFQDTSTAGMMALTCGLLFGLVFLFSPRYGLLGRILLVEIPLSDVENEPQRSVATSDAASCPGSSRCCSPAHTVIRRRPASPRTGPAATSAPTSRPSSTTPSAAARF